MSKNKSPDINTLLAQADKQYGFPSGTMASVVKQETGGNAKYLQDPSAYHYAANEKGQRIAGHTGKQSTAFGPFGILESTAKDPGYGVKPLQSKDLNEQIRFAGEYLAARSKQAGSLEAGLAGYGEGDKYAKQVLGRLGQSPSPLAMPDKEFLAQQQAAMSGGVPGAFGGEVKPVQFTSLSQPQMVLPPEEDEVPLPSVRTASTGPDQWEQLAQYVPQPINPADFGFVTKMPAPQARIPNPRKRIL